MTIYEIKKRTKVTAPYFFSKDTLRFFGQRISDFTVKKQNDGRYEIKAICRNAPHEEQYYTVRYFNPSNDKLELEGVCPDCGGDGFFEFDESSVHEGEVLESYGTEECKKCNGKGKVE